MDFRKKILQEGAGFTADLTASLSSGIPLPVSSTVKLVHYWVANKQIDKQYPVLKLLEGFDRDKVAIYLAEKIEQDFRFSVVDNKAAQIRARKTSENRFSHMREIPEAEKQIYLPVWEGHKELHFPLSLESAITGVQSNIYTKKCENLTKDLAERKKTIHVSVTAVCAASTAVLLSLKERFDLNLDIREYSGNAKKQLITTLENNDDQIDFFFTANPTFTFYSDELLGIKPLALLREIHYERQFLMVKPRYKRKYGRRHYIATYDKSTALEQFLLEFRDNFKPVVIDVFEDYPPQDVDRVIAWEPLASNLRKNGWRISKNSVHDIVFSIFGRPNRTDSLNQKFIDLFCLEWTFCKYNQSYAYSLLARDFEFLSSFAQGCGLYDNSDHPTNGSN